MTISRHGNRHLILAAGLLVWCSVHAALAATVVIGGGSMVDGSGNVIDDVRAVSGYTRVAVSGPVEVQLKNTGTERAVVHADDNIAPLIETRVEGGKLYIAA